MQTMYYTTRNFIRHEGNVVDLGEYRRRLTLAQSSLAPEWLEPEDDSREPAASPAPLRLVRDGQEVVPPQVRRAARRDKQAWFLDICASLSVVAMTGALTFTVLFG